MSTLARIVTTCQNGRFFPTVERNREHMMAILDRAMLHKPDLVVLPEAFPTASIRDIPLEERAEPLPGPTTDAAARRARANRCYVICPLKTRRDGRVWNSSVILDRAGQIGGVYDKIHPVTSTHDYTVFESGVAPGAGAGPAVFDLDFGRVALQICFDAGFPETWEEIARRDARVVFWSSAYDGGFHLQVYAFYHHVHVVSSVRQGKSRIIDPLGRIQCETNPHVDFVGRSINTDFLVSHCDFNHAIPRRALDAYPGRVDVRIDGESNRILIEPLDPTLTIAQIQNELGVESNGQYHQRHREAYACMGRGKTPTPQRARHGDRAMHTMG
ncbi:MAG: carbon-nitrogen hydrolase family protein [Candidatus Sumerlaeota bacterium]|nr:carbon-nitrogen hydrolase family protein [Candidatus Sumerlaeota bacterium]